MRIEKEKTKKRFADYVKAYDIQDPKVKLKVAHTYRVADLCEVIAASVGLNEEEQALAWLSGMLHDVGRFEQLRRYHTFVDSASVDHARLGADLLFGTNLTGVWDETDRRSPKQQAEEKMDFSRGILREFVEDDQGDELLFRAVCNHNTYRIENDLDERTQQFCHILRDADKIDILRVNIETPLEDIYNCTTQELNAYPVTEEVMQCFREEHAVLRSLKKVPIDHVVGHISLTYELVYPKSVQLMAEQGYLEQLMNYRSENEKAGAQFKEIRDHMHNYLKKRTEY